MARIPKSKLFPFDVDEEVSLRKLAEAAFEQVALEGLTDVVSVNPTDGDILQYNSSLLAWENVAFPIQSLNDIPDVNITAVSDGQVLTWDSAASRWVNETPSGGGGTPGGSLGQFQWNDGGSFGGASGFTWNFGTGQPDSDNGYLFGEHSSLVQLNTGGFQETTSLKTEIVSGFFPYLDLISNGTSQNIARIGTSTSGGSRFLQVEYNRTSPRYFDGTSLQEVYHTGNFDPATKQNQSANLDGWSAIATSSKQDTLVSGTNIKSINGNSLLGSGDLTITSGSSSTSLTVGWDGGRVNGVDQSLTSGLRFELRATNGLDPQAWTLLPKSGSSGDITVDVRIRPFSSGTFTAITAGSPPSISGGARGTGSATAWTNIGDGDLIEFEITSVSGTVTGVTLIVEANIV